MNYAEVLLDRSGDGADYRVDTLRAALQEQLAELGHQRVGSAGDANVVLCIKIGDAPFDEDAVSGRTAILAELVIPSTPRTARYTYDPTMPQRRMVSDFGWRVSIFRRGSLVGDDSLHTSGEMVRRVVDTVELLQQDDAAVSNLLDLHRLRLDIESFVHEWTRLSPQLHLSLEDRRTGDALATMASEVSKNDDPPTLVLRSAFRWFQGKVDKFADEAAAAAGKAFGASMGAGAGIVATGQLPRLISAVEKVLAHLS